MYAATRAAPSCAPRLLILTLLPALILVCLAPSTRAAAHRPFSAGFDTVFEAAVAFPLANISVNGEGHSLHMGATTAVSTDQVVNLATGAGTATYTLTAANGDALVLSLEFATAFPPTGVTFEGTFVVTGGTGRFADATGSGSAAGSATFTTQTSGIGSFTVHGTISY